MKHLLYILFMLAASSAPIAMAEQNRTDLRGAVESYLQSQTKDLPGNVSIRVDDIDSRLRLRDCPEMEMYLPSGAKLYGKTTVGVRCPGKDGWSVFVPAYVKVTAEVLIANHPLQQGQTLRENDFSTQTTELTQPGVLTSPSEATGRIVKYNIGSGQILRQEMFRAPFVVTQGQMVVLSIDGKGYKIRAEGQALNNASEGEAVRVRTTSGQVVAGIAQKDGSVTIRQ